MDIISKYGIFMLGSISSSLDSPPYKYYDKNPNRISDKTRIIVEIAEGCIKKTSQSEKISDDYVIELLKKAYQNSAKDDLGWVYYLVVGTSLPKDFVLPVPFADLIKKVSEMNLGSVNVFKHYPYRDIINVVENLARASLGINIKSTPIRSLEKLDTPPFCRDLLKRIKGHLHLLEGEFGSAEEAYQSTNPLLGFFYHEQDVLAMSFSSSGTVNIGNEKIELQTKIAKPLSENDDAFNIFAKFSDAIENSLQPEKRSWWRIPEKSQKVIGLVDKFASKKLPGFSAKNNYFIVQNFLTNPSISGVSTKIIRDSNSKKSSTSTGGREKSRVASIEKWLAKAPSGALLDIGGGDGGIAAEIDTNNREVVVFDVHLKPIHPKIKYIQNIDGTIPYSDNHFSIVLIYVALHHFEENLDKLLKEAYRVCKNDGLLIIREHNILEGEIMGYSSDEIKKYLDWVHLLYELSACRSPYTVGRCDYKTSDKWRELLESYGFSFVDRKHNQNMFFTYEESFNKGASKRAVLPIPSFFKKSISSPREILQKKVKWKDIEEKLNVAKSRLDSIPPKDYFILASEMDFYTDLKKILKSFGFDVVTNATDKMLEMAVELVLKYKSRLSEAELPGAFTMALNYYEITKLAQENTVWFASSFLDNSKKDESGTTTMLEDQYGLYQNYPDKWLMGPSSKAIPESVKVTHNITSQGIKGDLLGTADISVTIDTIKIHTAGKGVDLYTSDAGIDVSSDYNRQEDLTLRLNFGQIICGLGCLAKGGSMITKQYTFFNPLTRWMLYKLSQDFDEVFIIKPRTSRSLNSEIYIYAKGYHHSPTEFGVGKTTNSAYQDLRRVFVRMGRVTEPYLIWKDPSLKEEIEVPEEFDSCLLRVADELADTQILYIDYAIRKWKGELIHINKSKAISDWLKIIKPSVLPNNKKLKTNLGYGKKPYDKRPVRSGFDPRKRRFSEGKR